MPDPESAGERSELRHEHERALDVHFVADHDVVSGRAWHVPVLGGRKPV
jgi:hypothetical protein